MEWREPVTSCKTWVKPLCEWIEKHKPGRLQQVKIHIDHWDTWNMSETLAQIIAPMLRQKNGFRLFGKYYLSLWD